MSSTNEEYELSDGNIIPFGTYALANSCTRAEARHELEGLLKSSTTKYVPPYNSALIYNALGMRDEALGWLENGYQQRDPKMTFLLIEGKWNNLRNEPRFVDLMRRMNLQ